MQKKKSSSSRKPTKKTPAKPKPRPQPAVAKARLTRQPKGADAVLVQSNQAWRSRIDWVAAGKKAHATKLRNLAAKAAATTVTP